MGAPIYRPGIDMGEIDAMSRMRDDNTEASERIKELCPSLTTQTQIHMVCPAIYELFRLYDPAKTLAHERDHHIAYTHLHELLARLLWQLHVLYADNGLGRTHTCPVRESNEIRSTTSHGYYKTLMHGVYAMYRSSVKK